MTPPDKLRSFLVADLGCEIPAQGLADDLNLIDAQIIDSLGIYEIVTFIEREFGVEVADDELLPENFESISAITRFIESKR